MTWRAAGALTTLFTQLRAGAPRAVPPATSPDAWGLKGDAAHTTGDHVPHDFPGWGTDIVTAADFPNRPDLGLDAHRVLDDIRRSRDPRVKYGISNDQIFSSYPTDTRAAWTWGPYNPNDPTRDRHREHGHLSVVGDRRADGLHWWATIGAPMAAARDEDDMGGYGPVVMRAGESVLTLTVPPVGGTPAVPGPSEVWLNFGVDFEPSAWRIYVGSGAGTGAPADGTAPGGIVELAPFRVYSSKLPLGTRLISVMRHPLAAQADGVYGGPVVFNFEVR